MQCHFWRVLLQQQNGSQSNLALVVGLKSLYNSLHLYMNTRPSNWQSQVFTFVLGQLITEVHHLVFNAHVNCQGLQEGKNKTHPITNASLVYCSWHTITLFLKAWWKRKEKKKEAAWIRKAENRKVEFLSVDKACKSLLTSFRCQSRNPWWLQIVNIGDVNFCMHSAHYSTSDHSTTPPLSPHTHTHTDLWT